MPVKSGIDSVLDRLLRFSAIERAVSTSEPEQLETRSAGIPKMMPPIPRPFMQPQPPIGTLPPQPEKEIFARDLIPEELFRLVTPPPVATLPPKEQPKPIPDISLDEFTDSYFTEKGWNKKIHRALASNEERQEYDIRLKEASDAYRAKYGNVAWLQSGIAKVAGFLVTPAKVIAPEIDWGDLTTADKVWGGIDVATWMPFLIPFKGLKVLKVGKTAKISEIAAEKIPGMDTLKKTIDMFEKPPKLGKIPFKEKLGNLRLAFEEQFTDELALINKLTARNKAKYGGKIPVELNAELHAANLRGASSAGLQKTVDVYAKMKRTLGKDVNENMVDAYLHLKHQQEVIKMHPERAIPGGLQVDELEKGLEAMKSHLGEVKFKQVESAADVIKQHYNSLLDARVESGLASQDLADLLKGQYPWYNPIKYIEAEGKYAIGVGGKRISVTSSGIRRLSELGSEAAMERPLNSLAVSTIEAETLIRRNDAAKAVIKLALQDEKLGSQIKKVVKARPVAKEAEKVIFRRPPGEIRGTVSYMEGGKRQVYEVPQKLEIVMKALDFVPASKFEAVIAAINQISKTAITGANPGFFIPNFAIDSMTAILTQGISPLRIGKRLAINLKNLIKGDEVLRELRRSGGGMEGFSGKSSQRIIREARKSGQLVLQKEIDWKQLLANPIELLEKIGYAVEMSPRTARFETALKRGLTKEEAALLSRRITIDFSRAGAAIRHANNFFIYLNAGVQGALIPFRALRDTPISRLFISGYMASILGNYSWNRQFPEYEDVPNYIKYGSLLFMLPSEEYDKRGNKVPHYITIVPNLREFAMFSAPLIYTLRKLDGEAPEDIGQFLGEVLPGLNPLGQITGQSGLPVPSQLGETMTEIALNKDVYRDRPVVPDELIGLEPEKQYDEYTSETARRLGEIIGLSPKKIDYFVNSAFGGLGRVFISAVNAVISGIAPEDVDPRIADLYAQLQEIKAPLVAPEDISRRRDEFLYSLKAEDRETVLELERKPDKQIPLITPIMRRIYREGGGQLYKTGQALAEKETGISAKQTAKAGKILGGVSGELQAAQERIDDNVRSGALTMQEWRNNHRDQGAMYRGALLAVGVIYPSSAQGQKSPDAWNEFMNSVFTLASSMPDMRTRGDLLVAAWRSIYPEEITEGKMDWDIFFARRDEFKANLIAEDKRLLEAELKSRMTAIEKMYFDITSDERFSFYYKLPEGTYRATYREMFPEFDAFLNLGGFVTTTRTNQALALLKKKTNEYGIPFEFMPAVKSILERKPEVSKLSKTKRAGGGLRELTESIFGK